MVKKPIILILNTCHLLKQDPVSDNGDIEDLFQSTLGMPKYTRSHPTKMIESICNFRLILSKYM